MAFRGKSKYSRQESYDNVVAQKPKKKSGCLIIAVLAVIVAVGFSPDSDKKETVSSGGSNSVATTVSDSGNSAVGGSFSENTNSEEEALPTPEIEEQTEAVQTEEEATDIVTEGEALAEEAPEVEATPEPTPTPVQYPIIHSESGTKYVKKSAPIYSGAYDNFSILGYYSYGTEVNYTEVDTDKDGDDWYKISYNGTAGYVSHYYVQDTKPRPTPTPAPQPRQARTNSDVHHYVLNTSTHKFHYASCKRGPTKNKAEGEYSRSALISQGYQPCQNCNP